MAGRKKIRERGKVRFSEYFKELKEGDKVALKKEQSFPANFKERMQGKTGTIIGKRGRNCCYFASCRSFAEICSRR